MPDDFDEIERRFGGAAPAAPPASDFDAIEERFGQPAGIDPKAMDHERRAIYGDRAVDEGWRTAQVDPDPRSMRAASEPYIQARTEQLYAKAARDEWVRDKEPEIARVMAEQGWDRERAIGLLEIEEGRKEETARQIEAEHGTRTAIARTLGGLAKGGSFGLIDVEKMAASPEVSRAADIHASKHFAARFGPAATETLGAAYGPIGGIARAARAAGAGAKTAGTLAMGAYSGASAAVQGGDFRQIAAETIKGAGFGFLVGMTGEQLRRALSAIPHSTKSALLREIQRRAVGAVSEGAAMPLAGGAIHGDFKNADVDLALGVLLGGLGASPTRAMTGERAGEVKVRAVAEGKAAPSEVMSPERVEVAKAQETPEAAREAVEAMPAERRPDGSIEAGYKPTEQALREGLIEEGARPAVEKAQAEGVQTVSSGVTPEGKGFAIGEGPGGEVVRVEAEARPASEPIPGAPMDASRPTSIKNRVTNEERAARGVGPMEEAVRRTWGEVGERAFDIAVENPNRPRELALELRSNPRPHSDVEAALLDIERVNLRKARARADADGIDAAKRGDAQGVAEAKARATQANDDFLALEEATKRSGTETARGLGLRAAMMAEDYSLLAMETRRRAENDYKPLTEKQAAETKALHERLATAIAERDAYAARISQMEQAGSRKKPPISPKSPEYGARNRLVTREAYEATRAAMREKMSRLSANVDPTLLVDLAKIGAFHVEAGARTFASWARVMVDDLGEKVKPHLRAAWNETRRNLPEDLRSEIDRPVLKGLKTRLRGRTEELRARVESGSLVDPPRVPIHKDAEAVRLEANLETAKRAWNEALFNDRLRNQNAIQKSVRAVQQTAATARAAMTSFDLSAVGRQGFVYALTHPIRARKAMGAMFRALASPDAMARSEAEIRLRPTYSLAKKSGLFLAEHGGTSIAKMEEAYMSRVADKIPGVAASQRAYITFLNRARMDYFDSLVASLRRGAEPTAAEARAIASFVNVATGRGGPSGPSPALAALNHAFFSPRLFLSRVQFLSGMPLAQGSARTRRLVAGEYARFLGGAALIYVLASNIPGAEIEDDARSSDFGKIRFGDTRVDPMAGMLQNLTLLKRITSDETKDKHGKVKGQRFGDTVWRFLQNKAAPIPGAVLSAKNRRKPTGEPTSWGEEAVGLIDPMIRDDIVKAMEDQGWPRGAALGVLAMFGIGLQTHEEHEK